MNQLNQKESLELESLIEELESFEHLELSNLCIGPNDAPTR